MLRLKLKAGLLGLLALLAVSGIAASTAAASGPFWHVGGTKLGQGATKQIKLQSKSALVLKTPLLAVEVECKNSISENATIEGVGASQGQGTGRVTYTQCKVLKPAKAECKVAEPITTNQLKSFLALATPNQEKPKQAKMVNVFEPSTGLTFVILKFSEGCGTPVAGERGVNGAIAAELVPVEKEAQEGLVAFPSEAISKIKHEGQERTLKLEILSDPSIFSGTYGARLASNEPFGVFEQ